MSTCRSGEERDAEIDAPAAAIDEDADGVGADAEVGQRGEGVAHGTAGGEDVVHDEDAVGGGGRVAAPEGATVTLVGALGEGGADAELAGDLEGQQDAAGGRPGDDGDAVVGEARGEGAADGLGGARVGEQLELLDVAVAVPPGGEQEVPIFQRADLSCNTVVISLDNGCLLCTMRRTAVAGMIRGHGATSQPATRRIRSRASSRSGVGWSREKRM